MNFANFFSKIQEAPWYREFLNPVIAAIDTPGKLLDIGTGSGKMIQILTDSYNMECIGVDTDDNMLKEAKLKLGNSKAKLIKINPNEKLPFLNESFDFITICSVLFHLRNHEIDNLLDDAFQLLKKDGKIIILTPTGKGSNAKLTQHYCSFKNKSIYVWYNATKKKAKNWTKNQYLKQYAEQNNLNYHSEFVMNDFAQLEIIQ